MAASDWLEVKIERKEEWRLVLRGTGFQCTMMEHRGVRGRPKWCANSCSSSPQAHVILHINGYFYTAKFNE